jgi:hypothetical protein
MSREGLGERRYEGGECEIFDRVREIDKGISEDAA